MNVVPVPVAQVVPPSVLYCQVASGSTPETVTLVELLLPELLAVGKLMPIAEGAVVSMLMAAVLEAAVLVLPAASVWRTLIEPAA